MRQDVSTDSVCGVAPARGRGLKPETVEDRLNLRARPSHKGERMRTNATDEEGTKKIGDANGMAGAEAHPAPLLPRLGFPLWIPPSEAPPP